MRKSIGLTQEQVAEKLGISSRTLSRWETGAYMPDISMLVDIAEMYDVDVLEIIDGKRKDESMNSEVKEVAQKMADYSTMEKSNMLKWFKLMSIGTMIISLCLILLNFIRSVVLSEVMSASGGRIIVSNLFSSNALLMYVMFAFSIVVVVFSSERFQYIGQNSKTVKLTKIIIVGVIFLAFVSVFVSLFELWTFTQIE